MVVRAGWRSARWLDAAGSADQTAAELLARACDTRPDRPPDLARPQARAAACACAWWRCRKPAQAVEAARRKARREAQREGYQISQATLTAAEWVILVTSLACDRFCTNEVLALYRLRWRVELGFKRLKSVIGLQRAAGHRCTLRQALTCWRICWPSFCSSPSSMSSRRLVPQGSSSRGAPPRGAPPRGAPPTIPRWAGTASTRPGVWRLLRQFRATLLQPSCRNQPCRAGDDAAPCSDGICISRPDENASINVCHWYFSAYAPSRA